MVTYTALKNPADVTVKPDSRDKKNDQGRWAFFTDSWQPEIFGIAGCISCSIAIAIVLKVWAEKPVPILRHGFTVNAIISILATTSKSLMLFVVASCLGQLKWIWFQGQHKLSQFQLFDDASRGPLGAICLLCNRLTLVSIPTSIGALITIFALAFDPFVQQVLSFPPKPVSSKDSSAIVKQAFYPPNSFDPPVMVAINNGVWNTGFKQQPMCSTSNCTWDTFQSVGFCHRCQKVPAVFTQPCNSTFARNGFSNQTGGVQTKSCEILVDGTHNFTFEISVQVSEIGSNETIPLKAPVASIWNAWVTPALPIPPVPAHEHDWTDPGEIIGLTNPLIAMPIVNFTYSKDKGDVAIDHSQICAIDLCLRDHRVTVKNAVSTEETTTMTWGKKFNLDASKSIGQPGFDCWAPNATLDLDLHNITVSEGLYLSVDKGKRAFCWKRDPGLLTMWLWQAFFIDPFLLSSKLQDITTGDIEIRDPTNGTIHVNTWTYPCNGDYCGVYDVYDQSDWAFPTTALRQLWIKGPEQTIKDITDSLTLAASLNSNDTLQGMAQSVQPFVHVRWAWLILPALLNLGGLVLLSVTMYLTEKHKASLWKTSTNATLLHGLYSIDDIPNVMQISELDHVAESLDVRLAPSAIEDRLVLRHIYKNDDE